MTTKSLFDILNNTTTTPKVEEITTPEIIPEPQDNHLIISVKGSTYIESKFVEFELNFTISKEHEIISGKSQEFTSLTVEDVEKAFIPHGYLLTFNEHKENRTNSINQIKLTLHKQISEGIIKVDPNILKLNDEDLKAKLWKSFLAKQKSEYWNTGKTLTIPEGILNQFDRGLSSTQFIKLDTLNRDEMFTLYTYRQIQKKKIIASRKKQNEQAKAQAPEKTKRINKLFESIKYKDQEEQYKPLIAQGFDKLPELENTSFRYYLFPTTHYYKITHCLSKKNLYKSIFENLTYFEKYIDKFVIIIARDPDTARNYYEDLFTKQYGIYNVGREYREIHQFFKHEFGSKFRKDDECWTFRFKSDGKYYNKLVTALRENELFIDHDLELVEVKEFTSKEKESQKQVFLGEILTKKRLNWRNIRIGHYNTKQQDHEDLTTLSPGNRGTKRQRNRKDRYIEQMRDNLTWANKHERKAFAYQKRANYTKGSSQLMKDHRLAFMFKYAEKGSQINFRGHTGTVIQKWRKSVKIEFDTPIHEFMYENASIITTELIRCSFSDEKFNSIMEQLLNTYSFNTMATNEMEEIRLIENGHLLSYHEAVLLTFPEQFNDLSNLKFDFESSGNDLYVIYKKQNKYQLIDENLARVKLLEYETTYETTELNQLIKLKEELAFSQKIPGFYPTPHEIIIQMISKAEIKEGHSILETSAGTGFIIEQLNNRFKDSIEVHGCEINSLLREINILKDHTIIADDFLEYEPTALQYDSIIQNPPFENYQDIDFVYKAYDLLKAGGIMVSIMMSSRLDRTMSRKVVKKFIQWLDEIGDYDIIDLPAKSFRQSEMKTDVNTKMLVIRKSQ